MGGRTLMTSLVGSCLTVSSLLAVCGECDADVSSSVQKATEIGEYCQLELFHAACADGEVVVMKSAVYGRMRISRCVKRDYGFIGCSVDVRSYADRLCSGRQVCEFQVAELHGHQKCPGDLTPYLEASYECVPVITASNERCITGQSIPLAAGSGYLASSVTTDTGRGGLDCPWRLQAGPGQLINLTLINFARVGLPTDWSSSGGSGGTSVALHSASTATRPKICYQLANLRERQHTRVLTECEGSPFESHVLLSTSNVVEIDVIVAKILKAHFLLHYQAVGCSNPPVTAGMYVRREGLTATIRCNFTDDTWKLRCSGNDWIGQSNFNCSTDASASRSSLDDWTVNQLFPFDSFPYSILVVVSVGVAVGVALGVFVGGVLLVAAARYFKRLSEQPDFGPNDVDCCSSIPAAYSTYNPAPGNTINTGLDYHTGGPLRRLKLPSGGVGSLAAPPMSSSCEDLTDYDQGDGPDGLTVLGDARHCLHGGAVTTGSVQASTGYYCPYGTAAVGLGSGLTGSSLVSPATGRDFPSLVTRSAAGNSGHNRVNNNSCTVKEGSPQHRDCYS